MIPSGIRTPLKSFVHSPGHSLRRWNRRDMQWPTTHLTTIGTLFLLSRSWSYPLGVPLSHTVDLDPHRMAASPIYDYLIESTCSPMVLYLSTTIRPSTPSYPHFYTFDLDFFQQRKRLYAPANHAGISSQSCRNILPIMPEYPNKVFIACSTL